MNRLKRIRRLVRHFERITGEKSLRLAEASLRCARLAASIEQIESQCRACRRARAETLECEVFDPMLRRSADAWFAVLRARRNALDGELDAAEAEREARRNAVVDARRDERVWQTLAGRRERLLADEAILSAARETDELAGQARVRRPGRRTFRPIDPVGR